VTTAELLAWWKRYGARVLAQAHFAWGDDVAAKVEAFTSLGAAAIAVMETERRRAGHSTTCPCGACASHLGARAVYRVAHKGVLAALKAKVEDDGGTR
jgi:hypothetical protein